MSLDRVLVGVDFADGAVDAVRHAAEVAHRAGASDVVMVHARRLSRGWAEAPDRTLYERFLARQRHRVRAEFSALRSGLDDRGVSVTERIVDAPPALGIVQTAVDCGAKLVVVGSNGLGMNTTPVLGAVSEQVVRLGEVTVMVARGKPVASTGFTRVLVPTDFSTPASHALRFALEFVGGEGRIDVFHCWQLPGEEAWGPGEISASLAEPLRSARARVVREKGAGLLRWMQAPDDVVAFKHTESLPASGIRRCLDDNDYDCVVIGSHGSRSRRRWFVGSVAEATLRYSRCPVIVVN